jgi:hypothetical protein
MKGRGAGLVINLIVGIIGAYLGGIVFGLLWIVHAQAHRIFDLCHGWGSGAVVHRRARQEILNEVNSRLIKDSLPILVLSFD